MGTSNDIKITKMMNWKFTSTKVCIHPQVWIENFLHQHFEQMSDIRFKESTLIVTDVLHVVR